ncbi:glycosyltransferase family 2 protein [Vibrio artabrorum]|uniref:glycosyltransferase family 2 protein n=1 Tax=Vibrio artabrorum TaxID=446374 RepID=UPI00354BB691
MLGPNVSFVQRLPQESENRLLEGGNRLAESDKIDCSDLVSVITVTYNSEKFISRCIDSVINQSYSNIEHIIIDGGSSDSTCSIIESYGDNISYYVSEPDFGIYDAMNKGLSLARGSIIAILNSDDWYEDNAVELSAKLLNANQNIDYTYANINFVNGEVIKLKKPTDKSSIESKVLQEMVIPHISLFIRSHVYKELGGFKTKYRIAGDHEFLVRMFSYGKKGEYINSVIANAEDGGVSAHGVDANIESLEIAISYGKKKRFAYLDFARFVLNKNIARILGPRISKILMEIKGSRHA